jgi:uncharacterized glyoxalase superfamily protein PhnB
MTNFAKNCTSTVIPGLRYKNANAMIDWLCDAFAFEKKAVYNGVNGVVNHAELTFGNGMIMIGSADNGNVWSSRYAQPNELGGRETQCPCVIVEDADAHFARAQAAGAEILEAVEEKDYGGKGYSCRDIEGHLWYFGTYDPWKDGT